jgi:hypothetical protein
VQRKKEQQQNINITTMKTSNTTRAVEIGAGLAATGAAAALAYYFYGSDKAKQHRKKAAKWAHDMKGEVVKEIDYLRKTGPDGVAEVVDRVSRAYKDMRGVGSDELKRVVKELKSNWQLVQREAKAVTKKKPAKKTKK